MMMNRYFHIFDQPIEFRCLDSFINISGYGDEKPTTKIIIKRKLTIIEWETEHQPWINSTREKKGRICY